MRRVGRDRERGNENRHFVVVTRVEQARCKGSSPPTHTHHCGGTRCDCPHIDDFVAGAAHTPSDEGRPKRMCTGD